MYNIPYFKANNYEDVIVFMQANPFVTLCGVDIDNKPVATHIPVMFDFRDDKMFLQGHIMRKQNHTIAFENNYNVLAIFSTTPAYVSASNYVVKNIGSTINYQAVHANGIIKFMGNNFLYDLLTKLTNKFENNPNSPSLVHKMDEKYLGDNMKAIAGIEIEITDIQHIFKLSQNRDEESRNNIIEYLQNKEDVNAKAVAKAMSMFFDK